MMLAIPYSHDELIWCEYIDRDIIIWSLQNWNIFQLNSYPIERWRHSAYSSGLSIREEVLLFFLPARGKGGLILHPFLTSAIKSSKCLFNMAQWRGVRYQWSVQLQNFKYSEDPSSNAWHRLEMRLISLTLPALAKQRSILCLFPSCVEKMRILWKVSKPYNLNAI